MKKFKILAFRVLDGEIGFHAIVLDEKDSSTLNTYIIFNRDSVQFKISDFEEEQKHLIIEPIEIDEEIDKGCLYFKKSIITGSINQIENLFISNGYATSNNPVIFHQLHLADKLDWATRRIEDILEDIQKKS